MADAALIWSKFLQVPQEIGMTFNLLREEGLKAVTRGIFGLGTISTRFGAYKTLFALLNIGVLLFVDWFMQRYPLSFQSFPIPIRWICYWTWLFVMILILLSGLPTSEFIYFQF